MQIPASLRFDRIHIASELTIHIAGIRSKRWNTDPTTKTAGQTDGRAYREKDTNQKI